METALTETFGTAAGAPADQADQAPCRVMEGPSEGALWRDYLLSVLNKPIIVEEVHHEVQTAA